MGQPTIYLFYGDNTWSIRRKVRAWITAFEKKYGGTNIIDIDCSSSSPEHIIAIKNALTANTLFSTTSLLRIRGVFSKNASAIRDLLVEKLPSIPSTTFVIFEEESVDARTSFYKQLQKLHKEGSASIEHFEMPVGEDLKDWIVEYLNRYKTGIEQTALSLLVARFDKSGSYEDKTKSDTMWQLANELHKLVYYTGGGPIRHDDVEMITSSSENAHIFTLLDAILAKQKTRSYALAHDLVSSNTSQAKASVVSITAMLRSQLRALVMIKSMKDSSVSEAAMAAQLGWNPKRIWVVSRKVSGYSLEDLKRMYRHTVSFEEYTKTYSTPPGAALDILLTQLVG